MNADKSSPHSPDVNLAPIAHRPNDDHVGRRPASRPALRLADSGCRRPHRDRGRRGRRGDLNGNVMAIDASTGSMRFRTNTGQRVVGINTYAVRERRYVAVALGLDALLTWQTHSAPAMVVVLSLP